MGRVSRLPSETGIFHIIIRGINKMAVFEKESDCWVLLQMIAEVWLEIQFKIYACCIMDNHVHLLIHEMHGEKSISTIMRLIGTKYATWYNKHYHRTGYLFQDRFKSEPVENIEYFQTVFRYIHQNPLKAGLEKKMGEYRWNTYGLYLLQNAGSQARMAPVLAAHFLSDWTYEGRIFIDTAFPAECFGGWKEMIDFCERQNDDICMEAEEIGIANRSDLKARQVILRVSGCDSVSDFQALDKARQNDFIGELLREGIKKSQIQRLCGMTEYRINKIEKLCCFQK